MRIIKLSEHGYKEALLGLSLNYQKDVKDMPKVLNKLALKDGGHNKVLEFMQVYLDITAARYFWQEFDTYRIGVSKSSESTMHNLLDRDMTIEDLEMVCHGTTLWSQARQVAAFNKTKNDLTSLPKAERINELKKLIPESYLQRRIVCLNYKALRDIIQQRRTHQLKEWRIFCAEILGLLEHPEFLGG